MMQDERNRRPESQDLPTEVDQVNKIDQHCMDVSTSQTREWSNEAEKLLGEYNVDNWNDLYEASPDSLDELIKLAESLEIVVD